MSTHNELCLEVVEAIRDVAERRGLHIEQTPDAVNQLVSAAARASMAIAQAGDPSVLGIMVGRDPAGEVGVSVLTADGDYLDVVCE